MKYIQILSALLVFTLHSFAQESKVVKTKFVFGLSAPELLHAGFTHRLANVSLVGISVGVGPTWGGVWPTINAEHRLYFSKDENRLNQRVWFFRQGATFFTAAEPRQQLCFSLTAGKDILFKRSNDGITIDAGILFLSSNERTFDGRSKSFLTFPALRFQFYF